MIRLTACSAAVGDTFLLRDIHLDIEAGAFVSIVGPNGAGKSTLLKLILGLCDLRSGSLSLAGKPLASYSARQRAKLIGYVPQSLAAISGYTVYDLVMMGRYAGLPRLGGLRPRDHQATMASLALVSAEAFADRLLSTLSGGERQRVWLAAAMVQNPQILLLDEPLTYLDPKHQLEMMALLREIHRTRGTTILTVSHHLTHAFSQATHVLALQGGELAFFGLRDAFLQGDALERVFELPFTLVRHPTSGHQVPLPAAAS